MTSAIDELRLLLAGKANLWQIDVEQALGATMERLKDCSADDAVEFAMAGLRTIRVEHSWESHILTRAIGQLLRRKIPFTENQVLEMVQLASVPNKVFPFKGILTAAQSVPLTPSLADALRELRPCITE